MNIPFATTLTTNLSLAIRYFLSDSPYSTADRERLLLDYAATEEKLADNERREHRYEYIYIYHSEAKLTTEYYEPGRLNWFKYQMPSYIPYYLVVTDRKTGEFVAATGDRSVLDIYFNELPEAEIEQATNQQKDRL